MITVTHIVVIGDLQLRCENHINPLDARRRYTDFAQTSIRPGLRYTVQTARCHTRRQTVYLRYGA